MPRLTFAQCGEAEAADQLGAYAAAIVCDEVPLFRLEESGEVNVDSPQKLVARSSGACEMAGFFDSSLARE